MVTEGETTLLQEADDPRRIVADGYDAIAERYFAWSDARPSQPRLTWLAEDARARPAGSEVLDLGCGAGVPMTRALADGRAVTGVDISARQIELARAAVPGATFIHADMTGLDLASDSLDAVVAYYSLTHVPRADLPGLLAAIHRWLRPGGVLVATMGAQDSPDAVEHDWLGATMFFSHYGAKKNRALVRRAGFEIELAVVEAEPEDRHDALFLWVIARKPTPAGSSMPDAPGHHPGPVAAMLPADIREAIVAHARAEYPNEACGIIVGDACGGGRRPGAPVRADAQRGGLAAALPDRRRAAAPADDRDRRRGRGVLGHRPLARALSRRVPSPTDVGQATIYRDPLYVLVSLSDDEADAATGEPSVRAWRILDGEVTEVVLR